MALDILIIDDEDDIRDLIAGILEDEGYETRQAHDANSALNEIARRRPSLVFLDIWMQGSRLDGLQLLDVFQSQHPDMPVVMISGHGNVETAVSAIRRGAYDYIEKPFKIDRLLLITQRAMEATRLKTESRRAARSAPPRQIVEMVGHVARHRSRSRAVIEKSAPTNSRIFISGPSGTGKGLCARLIHQPEPAGRGAVRRDQLLALSPDEVPVVLFGRENAREDRQAVRTEVGALERAHGGTLYLSEVTALPQRRRRRCCARWSRTSSTASAAQVGVPIDVRIISSSSQNVAALIEDGTVPLGSVPPPVDRAAAADAAQGAPRGRAAAGQPVHRPDLPHAQPAAPARSATTRWPCCRPRTGPATPGSCAIRSSAC